MYALGRDVTSGVDDAALTGWRIAGAVTELSRTTTSGRCAIVVHAGNFRGDAEYKSAGRRAAGGIADLRVRFTTTGCVA